MDARTRTCQFPHGPWMEALSHYVEHAPEDVLRAHIERHGGELSRLVPALEDRVPDAPRPRETDPDTQRYLLWAAVVGLLREASDAEPIVLVLDDLHSADKPSLLLLKHVLAQAQGLHALVVGTYRESELAHGHLSDVLADMRRETGIERLSLKGLDEVEITEIMEGASGHALDQAGRQVSRELLRETDGNPFYVVELLRHLLDSDVFGWDENGGWTARSDLVALGSPESVRDVISCRVERLGEHAVEVLSTAAVIGRDFDADLLLRVGIQSEDELLGLLDEAVSALVLVESADVAGRFSFAHALINHTLYGKLGTTRCARLHRRIAETLEEPFGPAPGTRVAELAHHWAKASGPVGARKAMTYARLAGERALSALDPDEALRWFQKALTLQDQQGSGERTERCEILIGPRRSPAPSRRSGLSRNTASGIGPRVRPWRRRVRRAGRTSRTIAGSPAYLETWIPSASRPWSGPSSWTASRTPPDALVLSRFKRSSLLPISTMSGEGPSLKRRSRLPETLAMLPPWPESFRTTFSRLRRRTRSNSAWR